MVRYYTGIEFDNSPLLAVQLLTHVLMHCLRRRPAGERKLSERLRLRIDLSYEQGSFWGITKMEADHYEER